MSAPAILVLNPMALATARRIQDGIGGDVLGLAGRVGNADASFADTGETLRRLFADGRPLVGLFAAGILIRCLAPLLADKQAEPPVVAVAPDGSAVVPLLGGLTGAEPLAERIAAALGTRAAHTATGSIRNRSEAAALMRKAEPRGSLAVVGLGPGNPLWLTPEAQRALEAATDLVGYRTYLDLLPPLGHGRRLHGSDNRVEMDRARQALDLAAEGRAVALVSSGDPGIFAMAAAVMEALEAEPGAWAGIELRVLPGVSAMQAAAARAGAPLGHDFAVLSLSDIRKPWDVIERRLRLAAEADLVVVIYNPASSERREQLARAKALLLERRSAATPVVVARDVGRPAEAVTVTTLGALDPASIDMRTLLIVGSSHTRAFVRPDGRVLVYAPRSHPAVADPAP